jgi:hypothetical protein
LGKVLAADLRGITRIRSKQSSLSDSRYPR